jgi:predicted nucleic acid-binding protein
MAGEWGKQLIKIHDSDAIVTVIMIEILGGTTSAAELTLMRAFLRPFQCVDQQKVTAHDWREAIRLSSRVPRDRRTRQLGDCLIRAIANRLHYDVITHDQGFPG